MRIVLLMLCIAFAGCGTKSNDDIAKDLVTEKLKASLPDFSKYESVNFTRLGKASLPYEESNQYITNLKNLNACKDSIAVLEKIIKENKTASATANMYKERLQQLLDSTKAISERNNSNKQSYTPEPLFKITHDYTLKDKVGIPKRTEDDFYFDKDLKRVVKVQKVY